MTSLKYSSLLVSLSLLPVFTTALPLNHLERRKGGRGGGGRGFRSGGGGAGAGSSCNSEESNCNQLSPVAITLICLGSIIVLIACVYAYMRWRAKSSLKPSIKSKPKEGKAESKYIWNDGNAAHKSEFKIIITSDSGPRGRAENESQESLLRKSSDNAIRVPERSQSRSPSPCGRTPLCQNI